MYTVNFSQDIGSVTLYGDIFGVESDHVVLCLHGGGARGRVGFEKMRRALESKGISTHAFDYKGHGDTGGKLTTTSLLDKVNQTKLIIASQKIKEPFSIIASSMGAYIAIKMTELYDVENLILLAPAVYDKDAYTVPFGFKFSSIIRRQLSWLDSDAWDSIKKYTGNMLVIQAGRDQVIPNGLVEKIYQSAVQTKTKEVIRIENATHPLTDWINSQPDDFSKVIDSIFKRIM
jgi:uncharacterized protein